MIPLATQASEDNHDANSNNSTRLEDPCTSRHVTHNCAEQQATKALAHR